MPERACHTLRAGAPNQMTTLEHVVSPTPKVGAQVRQPPCASLRR